MKKNMVVYVVVLFIISLAFSVNVAQAELCGTSTPSIKGEFSTFSLGNNTLGLLEGKCVEGKDKLEGAISGEIIPQPDPNTIITNHVLAIPGYGLVFTFRDRAIIVGVDSSDPDCPVLLVEEEINIVGGTQEFLNCKGSGYAEGTVTTCTGESNFEFEAELHCP